jgi:hypothetical protein
VLPRPHDHHRDVRRRTPYAIAIAKSDQDRHLMIITALPASQRGFSSPQPRAGAEADVLTRSPLLLRPPCPRQARPHWRSNTPAVVSPAPRLLRHQPPGPSAILKISIDRARPNSVPSCPRFPPWEAFERRPRPGVLHRARAGVRNPSPSGSFPIAGAGVDRSRTRAEVYRRASSTPLSMSVATGK